jgi:predicted solute-binding protein
MYVNDLTLDMGIQGRKALETMFEMARKDGILPASVNVEII